MGTTHDPARPYLLAASYALALAYAAILAPQFFPAGADAHVAHAALAAGGVVIADLPERWRTLARRIVDIVRRIRRWF